MCDPKLHQQMYSNIIPAGGSTMLPGFNHRLRKDLNLLAGEGTKVWVPIEDVANVSFNILG
jgi:actin-related protein